MKRERRDRLIFTLLGVVLVVAVGFFASIGIQANYQTKMDRLAKELANDQKKASIRGAVSAVAAVDNDIAATATSSLPQDNPQTTKKLRNLLNKLGLDSLFIMSKDGIVNSYITRVAQTTITGENFGWRPYFTADEDGSVYVAVGTNTKKRGFYISAPIHKKNSIVGVLVSKYGFDEVDRSVNAIPFPVIVISPEGVVFASNRPEWVYKSIATTKSPRIEQELELLEFNSTFMREFSSEINWKDPFGRWRVIGYVPFWELCSLHIWAAIIIFVSLFVYLLYRLKETRYNVYDKAKKIRRLLDNSKEGFLSFGKQQIIDSEYSRACKTILGIDPAGTHIADLISPTDKEFSKDVLSSVFETKDPMLKKELLQLLPSKTEIDRKLIGLDYKPIEDEKIMVILNDITDKHKVEKELEIEQKNLRMIVLAAADKNNFFEIIDGFKLFIQDLKKQQNNGEIDHWNEIYREIHTHKGLLNQLSFSSTPDCLNDIEICLSKKLTSGEATKIHIDTKRMEQALDEDLTIVKETLGENFLVRGRTLVLTKKQVYELEEILNHITSNNIDRINLKATKDLLLEIARFKKIKIADAIKSFDCVVEQIAIKLKKQVAPIEINDPSELIVEMSKYKNLLRSFIHIFRNAIVHGIEAPDIRWERNKDIKGAISCDIEQSNNEISISISDDGGGIDIEMLRKASGDYASSEYDIINLIFLDHISTNANPDDLSGRGVGLSAVAYEVEKLNGKIVVTTQQGIGTTFKIIVPKIA